MFIPSLDDSFITWMNRPYLDMGDVNTAPLHVYGISYAYSQMVGNTIIGAPLTLIHPISFRESLIREYRLFKYQVTNPLDLADELRTERWNTLCDYLTNYQELAPIIQFRVISLLSSLCLHKAVLQYVPQLCESDIASSNILANLALQRALSNLMIQPDAGNLDNIKEFETIAKQAPLDSHERFGSANSLVVLYAKTFRNLKATEYWVNETSKTLDHLKPLLNNFEQKRLQSVYIRAAVFVHLLQGDKQEVVQQMNLCQSLAEELTEESTNDQERMLAHENLTTVFESRVKEASWLGNFELAEERAQKMVQMEPLYSKYHLQLGEILINQSKFEEAAKIYRSAARLGPPGTAIAWFMAGQCHEKLGDIDIACDCYLASVEMDELAISAVERLHKLAHYLRNSALVKWSEMRLLELKKADKLYDQVQKSQTTYIPEAASGLKMAGQVVR